MTRKPSDFDSMSSPSTIWVAQSTRLQFAQSLLVLSDQQSDMPLSFSQVLDLSEQLDAWLEWRRNVCPHDKFVRTNKCKEPSCSNAPGWMAREVQL